MKRSPNKGLLRRLLNLGLGVGLCLQLAVLLAYLIYGHIPIPRDIANYLLQKAGNPEYPLSASQFRLSLSGDLLVEGLSVTSTDFKEPIITAQEASIHLDWLHFPNEILTVEKIVLANGTLFLLQALLQMESAPHSSNRLLFEFFLKQSTYASTQSPPSLKTFT